MHSTDSTIDCSTSSIDTMSSNITGCSIFTTDSGITTFSSDNTVFSVMSVISTNSCKISGIRVSGNKISVISAIIGVKISENNTNTD